MQSFWVSCRIILLEEINIHLLWERILFLKVEFFQNIFKLTSTRIDISAVLADLVITAYNQNTLVSLFLKCKRMYLSNKVTGPFEHLISPGFLALTKASRYCCAVDSVTPPNKQTWQTQWNIARLLCLTLPSHIIHHTNLNTAFLINRTIPFTSLLRSRFSSPYARILYIYLTLELSRVYSASLTEIYS